MSVKDSIIEVLTAENLNSTLVSLNERIIELDISRNNRRSNS